MPNHKIIHLSWWNEGSPLAKCREHLTYQGPTSSPILTIKNRLACQGALVTVKICVFCGWWFIKQFDVMSEPPYSWNTFGRELAVSCFCDLFKIKHTFSKICMRFSITDLRFIPNLCFIDFHIFGSSFPWKYRLPQKTHSTKLQFFFKNWCNFHIDQSKWRLVKRQLKFSLRYGPEKNCIEPP